MARQVRLLDPHRLPKEICRLCRRFVNPTRTATGVLECPVCHKPLQPT